MIRGMNTKDMVHIDNGLSIVCLDSGTYKIDEQEVTLQGYRNQFTITTGTEVRKKVIVPRQVEYIVDGSGNKITQEEFSDMYNFLLSPYRDEDYSLTFPSLDVEYKVKKKRQEMEQWERIYKDEEVRWEAVEFNVLGSAVETGSSLIECSIFLGSPSFNSGYMYRVLTGAAAKQAFLESSKGYKTDLPSHSNIQYVKIGGEFVFTQDNNQWVKNADSFKLCKTLGEANKELKKVQDYVIRKVKVKVAEQQGKVLDSSQLTEVVSKLRKIKLELEEVTPMKKSERNYRQSISLINGLVTSLEDALLEV